MILNANALHIPLADKSVQCVVTSPPYWGLRDYGIPGQLGLEPTPEEYVANMVAVFREVRRVMRDDGTLWLNLGDSYNGSGKGPAGITSQLGAVVEQQALNKISDVDGLKPKDLVGIPWRVAFALQADGWYLRSDIIWHKPNPMPESVTDRPTKAHEYIFLLTKSARYFYDAEAIKEGVTGNTHSRGNGDGGQKRGSNSGYDFGVRKWGNLTEIVTTRNRRTVWTIPTSPYSGAHFATFPPDLVRPCILAGTSPKACEKCGAPWVRVVERTPGTSKACPKTDDAHIARGGAGKPVGTVGKSGSGRTDGYSITTGFRPTCSCDHAILGDWPEYPPEPDEDAGDGLYDLQCAQVRERRIQYIDAAKNIPTGRSIVLDPFAGTFTVGMVAAEYGRRAVGLELNRKYIGLALERTEQARAQGVMQI